MKFILVVATMATLLTMTSSVQARLLASTPAPQAKTCTTRGDCQRGTQFCGTDNQCHDFSCPAWFQNSGWNETSIGSTQLACQDYSTGDQDENNNYAVVYGCQAIFGPVVPAAKGSAQPFTRKCTATIGKQAFECYDLKPNSDFTNFLSIAKSAPQSCIDHNDGAVLKSSFIYRTIFQTKESSSISAGGASGLSSFHASDTGQILSMGPLPTETFDESLVPLTMWAISTKSDTTSTTSDTVPQTAFGIVQSPTGVYVSTEWNVVEDADDDVIESDDNLNNVDDLNSMAHVVINEEGSYSWIYASTRDPKSGAHMIKPAYATSVLVGLMALLF
jgi:hypothetical protein